MPDAGKRTALCKTEDFAAEIVPYKGKKVVLRGAEQILSEEMPYSICQEAFTDLFRARNTEEKADTFAKNMPGYLSKKASTSLIAE